MDKNIDLTDYSSRREAALAISQANEALIRSCVALIANVTPFRGVSADVGTAYEMGFGRALGHLVAAYTNVSATFIERNSRAFHTSLSRDDQGRLRDVHDMAVEEWDLMDNLMLEGGIHASRGELVIAEVAQTELFAFLGGFETCVQRVSRILLVDASLPQQE